MPRIRARTIVEHKELIRSELLDAACDLFAAQGLAGTNLGDVAAVADVGRTTLYEYFPNKQDLFLALIEDRVPGRLAWMVRRLPAGSPIERLEALFATVYAEALAQRKLAYVMFRVGRELPAEERDRMWRSLQPVTDEILRLCESGISSGEIGGDDPVVVAQLVADLLSGGIDQLLGSDDMDAHAPSLARERIRFLRNGLTAGLQVDRSSGAMLAPVSAT